MMKHPGQESHKEIPEKGAEPNPATNLIQPSKSQHVIDNSSKQEKSTKVKPQALHSLYSIIAQKIHIIKYTRRLMPIKLLAF